MKRIEFVIILRILKRVMRRGARGLEVNLLNGSQINIEKWKNWKTIES
jgi:hypothetical protein